MTSKPFDNRDGIIWMNGNFIDWNDARCHIITQGMHYASAVFEGERLYNGSIFKSQEHTDRLLNSANVVGYEIPYKAEEIEKAKLQVIEAMGLVDGYIRPIAWRGTEMMGVSAQQNTIHFLIMIFFEILNNYL